MRLFACVVIMVVLGAGLHCSWIGDATAADGMLPSLSDVVLFGVWNVKELQGARPAEEEICVRRYLESIPRDSPLWSMTLPPEPEEASNARRRCLIEQMVAILGEKVRDEAASFAAAVPLQLEWEGMSEGPLDEANFVDNWLEKRPGTSIAPFLHLFRAHRLRAGYEAARSGGEKGLRPVLAARYHEAISKARSSANPFIFCIAGDLERKSHVYLQGQGRP